ncbi:MAG: copper resistance protein CopC [Gemmatimonadota bacterium]
MVPHLGLQSSVPAKGDTVREALREMQLTFTQAIELRYTQVTTVSTRGDTLPGSLEESGSEQRAVLVRLAEPLTDGGFTVTWRTAGADGHVVSGNFGFTVVGVRPVAPVDSGRPPTGYRLPPEHQVPPEHREVVDVNLRAAAVATRWLNYALILVLTGGVAFWSILTHKAAALGQEYVQSAWAVMRWTLVLAAIASLLLAVLRLALQSSALHGAQATWDMNLLVSMVTDTRWGQGWLLVVSGAIVLLIGSVNSNVIHGLARAVAAAGVAFLVIGSPLAGHAAAVEKWQIGSIAIDGLHVLAAGLWIGTLACVLFIGLPIALRISAYTSLAVLVRAFSSLALVATGTVVLTGSISAIVHLTRISELWQTDYGQTLGLKLLAVAGTGATGIYNWRRVQPVLGTEISTVRLRRSATIELTLALLVLLATAFLVAMPTP